MLSPIPNLRSRWPQVVSTQKRRVNTSHSFAYQWLPTPGACFCTPCLLKAQAMSRSALRFHTFAFQASSSLCLASCRSLANPCPTKCTLFQYTGSFVKRLEATAMLWNGAANLRGSGNQRQLLRATSLCLVHGLQTPLCLRAVCLAGKLNSQGRAAAG